MLDQIKLHLRKISFREFILPILVVTMAFFFAEGGCSGGGGSSNDNTSSESTLDIRQVDHTYTDNATEVSDEDLEKMSINDNGTKFSFPSTTDAYDSLQSDDVIVAGISSETPEGMLKKVTDISKHDDKITAEVENATLVEAFENLNLDFSKELNTEEIRQVSTRRGVTTYPGRATEDPNITLSLNVDKVIYDKDKNKDTTNDQITLSGTVDVSIKFDFVFSFNKFPTPDLKTFKFTPIIEQSNEVVVKSNVSADIKKKKPLATYYFGAFPVGPVVFTPQLNLVATAEGEVCVEMKTGVTQNFNYKYTVAYQDSDWTTYGEKDTSFDFISPDLTGSLETEAGLGLPLTLKLYGVAGPHAGPKGYLGFSATASASNSELCWDLYTGVSASGGVKVGIFRKIIWASAELTLFDLTKNLAGDCYFQDNQRPTAKAGPDQTVIEGEQVILDGTNSSDPDDGINSYQWDQVGDGPTVNLTDSNLSQGSFIAPEVDAAGNTLDFQLTVEDFEGNQDTDTCSVTVQNSVNQAPIADAGSDQTTTESEEVTLDASGSSDPDGDPISYEWNQTGGTSVSLSDPNAEKPTFTAPDVGSSGDTLTFELTVTDDSGATSSDGVNVNVTSQYQPLQSKNINVDGMTDDWSDENLIHDDANNDSLGGDSTEIDKFYMAENSNYIYFRLDLMADAKFPHSGHRNDRYEIKIEEGDQHDADHKDFSVQIWGKDDFRLRDNENKIVTSLNNVVVSSNIIEGSVAKDKIENMNQAKVRVWSYYWHSDDDKGSYDDVGNQFISID